MIKNSEIEHGFYLELDKQFSWIEEGKIKEIFQKIVLKHIYSKNSEVLKRLAFLGGTCLRIIYNTGRYSEDLDFSLYDVKDGDIEEIENILFELSDIYESVEIKVKNKNTNVKKYEIIISDIRSFGYDKVTKDKKVRIKFEFDINPPDIGDNILEFVEFDGVEITIHSKRLLKSGKLSAILFRSYYKGRDFFDLDVYIKDDRFKNVDFDINYIERNWNQNLDSCSYLEELFGEDRHFNNQRLKILFDYVISGLKDEHNREKVLNDIGMFSNINDDGEVDFMIKRISQWSENFSFSNEENFDLPDYEEEYYLTNNDIVSSFNYWNKNNHFSQNLELKDGSILFIEDDKYKIKRNNNLEEFDNKQILMDYFIENKYELIDEHVINRIRK